MSKKTGNASDSMEKAARKKNDTVYVLRLYVAGITPGSETAIRSVTEICEKHLNGRYELEVIDIYQQPELTRTEQIIAAPTLIKKLPLPLRRLIGNMASEEKVLLGLDLKAKNDPGK